MQSRMVLHCRHHVCTTQPQMDLQKVARAEHGKSFGCTESTSVHGVVSANSSGNNSVSPSKRVHFLPCTSTEQARPPHCLAALQPDPAQRHRTQVWPGAPALHRWKRPLDPASLTARRR